MDVGGDEGCAAAIHQSIKSKILTLHLSGFFVHEAKHPRFTKKGIQQLSGRQWRADAQTVAFDGKRIRIPVIGWVKMRESLRFVGKLRSVTVSRVADR